MQAGHASRCNSRSPLLGMRPLCTCSRVVETVVDRQEHRGYQILLFLSLAI